MTASSTAVGRRVEVNGVSLYVEEHGLGDPLVLVHGGLVSSATWAGALPILAEHYRVVIFDSRGHGRSTNPTGTLSYEVMADDTAALIDALGLDRPFVGGWSDGAEVALQFGLRHPGRARAVVAFATSLELGTEAVRAEIRAIFGIDEEGVVDLDVFAGGSGQTLVPMMRQWHPHGEEHWQRIVQQSATMWLTYAGLTREQVERIDAPVLVAVGDRDEHVPVEEAVRLFRWLPQAELAVLPGASHMRPILEPASLVSVVIDFLHRH
jgi:pimeloyl-ACP methyl ester carboxylesterase